MRTNKSAARAIDIIELISKKRSAASITEISQALDIPKSSTFELVYTLVEKGYLEIEDQTLKTFNLGLKLFEAGIIFLEKTDLHREARSFLEKMAEVTGQTVFLAVEDKGELVYLDKVEGASLIHTTANLGSRKLMHNTALGKALLAAYPRERVEAIIKKRGLQKTTEYTIGDLNKLLSDLEHIRQRRYAIDNRESALELFCFAAPIYDRSNKAMAAIGIASIYSQISDERIEKFGQVIVQNALNISNRLGFIGEKLYF